MNKKLIIIISALIAGFLIITLTSCNPEEEPADTNATETTGADETGTIPNVTAPAVTDENIYYDGKPVIYLYPQTTADVSVILEYDGTLDCTYPAYNDGWSVTAYPDGTLINHADGLEYSYLFWDGFADTEYDFSRGFVIRGEDTAAFLRETLAYMGLTPREYNEFIVYWLPKIQHNPYNLIAFQSEAYTDSAKLIINPEPDSLLRVFMAYKPLNEPVDIPPQELEQFERVGFTVVEWGGSEVK